ncbi:hypothetical protein BV25DRAFT_1910960 [Artomyces pyxidatus]|uniref:Uncharacterized protein n=1 Tax=Artomyces pyxidatus TaxID=48021 RepID=A0ACB8TLH3_9AGAM|nr:hypothetical protein BV25DRAFT_1910960 [Artomyces pyxidatus]
MPVLVPMNPPSEESISDYDELTSDSEQSTTDGSTSGTDVEMLGGAKASSLFSPKTLSQIFDSNLWRDVDDLRAMGESQKERVKQMGAKLELLERNFAAYARRVDDFDKLDAAVDAKIEAVKQKLRRVQSNLAILRERKRTKLATESAVAQTGDDQIGLAE